MNKLVILFHSGYGHTEKQAHSVLEGAKKVSNVEANLMAIPENGELSGAQWEELAEAEGIIFGSPTYMGGVSWQFKKVADASSKPWFGQQWKDKIAAGFTNSATINGDKFLTVNYLQTLAMQHGMVWVGVGLMPSNAKDADRNDINYLGGFNGLFAQSPSDSSPEEGPLPGDLKTAILFGERIANAVARWNK
ncbi:flavodoxin family protein [Paraneptunicella aestuarii]|uniref:flavodoxin family protein n=1 Tax=Paraneptunicella aestuarii TaxID=2831148 RepID=UPI001E4D131D|nr:flavodoxin family protein [Paraneptunicella aestuarii]UAA37486.1 flavodoxin family protein [Paraneptunicella aestuarii]